MPDADLDLSELSDDQLIELACACARAAMRRNPALQVAFHAALLDERERAEAMAAGVEKARKKETVRLAAQAEHAEALAAVARARHQTTMALRGYVQRIAAIIGHETANITLSWLVSELTRRREPRLRVTLGPKGARASWSLVEYVPATDCLNLAPGLKCPAVDVLNWCREVVAVIAVLGVDRDIEVKGIEL